MESIINPVQTLLHTSNILAQTTATASFLLSQLPLLLPREFQVLLSNGTSDPITSLPYWQLKSASSLPSQIK